MTAHEKAIARLRGRIALALLFKHALLYLTVWVFLWGTAVVVLRLTAGVSPWLLLAGLAAAPVLVALAVVPAWRRLPAPAAVRALVDRASGCGGLLAAGEDHELGPWQEALPPPAGLRVYWHGTRSWALFGAGAVFLLAALLFPERLATLGATRTLEIGSEVARLAAQLDLLKKEDVLPPERADDLKEKLTQLKEQSRGESPVKTLEALDHLRDTVSKAAREAAESALGKNENLARAEALAEALRQADRDVSPKVKADALAELAALVQKAAAESGALDKRLGEKVRKALKAGKLSRAELAKLARALRGSKQDLAGMLEKLNEARLIDPELLKELAKAGEFDAAALADLLKGSAGKMTVGEMMARCQGKEGPGRGKTKSGRPGRGGLTEGPGAAELTFGDKTTEEGAKFKEQALPAAALKALKESRLAGVDQEAPPTEKGAVARPGALGKAAAGGGSANTQVILPRHRPAVERYFERPARKSGQAGDE